MKKDPFIDGVVGPALVVGSIFLSLFVFLWEAISKVWPFLLAAALIGFLFFFIFNSIETRNNEQQKNLTIINSEETLPTLLTIPFISNNAYRLNSATPYIL